jgi:hypothetical protein
MRPTPRSDVISRRARSAPLGDDATTSSTSGGARRADACPPASAQRSPRLTAICAATRPLPTRSHCTNAPSLPAKASAPPPRRPDDDDEDGAAGDVLDSEWAADVNDEPEEDDARVEAPVHVDRQSASGAWPMPLFLRIERVLVSKKEERASVRAITDVPTAIDEDM